LPQFYGCVIRKLRIYVRRTVHIHSLSKRTNKKMIFQHCPNTFKINGFFNGISARLFVDFLNSLGIEGNMFLL
jgi:hypothetical protein